MKPISATNHGVLESLEGTFSRLRTQMAELGLNLSIWDCKGQCVEGFTPACELCGLLYEAAGSPCRDEVCRHVETVLAEGKPSRWRTERGCCIIGVPVYKRRRLVGVAIASYMPLEVAENPALLRKAAGEVDIPETELARMANESCRHGMDEADDFLKVLDSLLKHEQALDVAQEELTTLSTNLATTYEELSLLYRISGSMKVTQKSPEFLQDVCSELFEVMNISAAVAVVFPRNAENADLIAMAGDLDLNRDQIRMLAVTQIAPRFAKNNRPLLDNRFKSPADSGLGNSVKSLIAAPLIVDKDPMGVLIGINKTEGDFDSVDLKLINSIANQTAIFLSNHRLYDDLQDLLMGVLHALTATIDAKDPYTCGHSRRVAIISKRLAEEYGFGPEKVQQLYLAGLLHDIGKIGVPEATLRKEGRLTNDEYESIKRHPVISARILGGIRQLDNVMLGILHHHERLDGRGYPDGLAGDDVPIEGLIVGLADCFDAMTSDRTYRKALPLETAIDEIKAHSGTQFHPVLVEKLLSLDLEAFLEELRRPSLEGFIINFEEELK